MCSLFSKVAGCMPVALIKTNSFKGSFKGVADIKSHAFTV